MGDIHLKLFAKEWVCLCNLTVKTCCSEDIVLLLYFHVCMCLGILSSSSFGARWSLCHCMNYHHTLYACETKETIRNLSYWISRPEDTMNKNGDNLVNALDALPFTGGVSNSACMLLVKKGKLPIHYQGQRTNMRFWGDGAFLKFCSMSWHDTSKMSDFIFEYEAIENIPLNSFLLRTPAYLKYFLILSCVRKSFIMPPFEKGGAYCFAHVGRYVGRYVGIP